jgi:hypothetical protein
MEELLKEISAKLDAIKGLLSDSQWSMTAKKIISTPFGTYRMNAETGKREKVEFVNGEWVVAKAQPSPPPVDNGNGPIDQWNLYPWPGEIYWPDPPPDCPPGHHLEYNYRNNEVRAFKDCGPIGG